MSRKISQDLGLTAFEIVSIEATDRAPKCGSDNGMFWMGFIHPIAAVVVAFDTAFRRWARSTSTAPRNQQSADYS